MRFPVKNSLRISLDFLKYLLYCSRILPSCTGARHESKNKIRVHTSYPTYFICSYVMFDILSRIHLDLVCQKRKGIYAFRYPTISVARSHANVPAHVSACHSIARQRARPRQRVPPAPHQRAYPRQRGPNPRQRAPTSATGPACVPR